jgi:hypothetical protein
VQTVLGEVVLLDLLAAVEFGVLVEEVGLEGARDLLLEVGQHRLNVAPDLALLLVPALRTVDHLEAVLLHATTTDTVC